MEIIAKLPSPCEVDRFISKIKEDIIMSNKTVSVPSRGKQVYIKLLIIVRKTKLGFRPLARYIGLYPAQNAIDELWGDRISVPSRGSQVYIFASTIDACNLVWFPSLLEVDRFISWTKLQKELFASCFRPLARWIVLYLDMIPERYFYGSEFPSPLEVYRFISYFGG